jgi:phosphoglycerate dehydrogenase-like enzyme
MPALREAVFSPGPSAEVGEALAAGGVRNYVQPSEGFWGQSIAEFALALTLCGLRRIPQRDMTPLRERVLADELALAADVWDVESLPLDDPPLGRQNVVHTPHIAGRTRDANLARAENLAAQFDPSGL